MADAMMDLSAFDVDEVHGFLPTKTPPASRFQNPYYQPWDDIADHLADLLSSHQLRKAVQELPCLTTSHFTKLFEWKRAYVVLGFIVHAYVWAEDPAAERVPSPVAIPYLQVCSELEIAPVASYACLCLWNYRLIDLKKAVSDPSNLNCLVSFTPLRDETWFYMMSVAIEAQGGTLVGQLTTTMQHPSKESVLHSLRDLSLVLDGMTTTIGRMHEHLDPACFYNSIRPWIMGFRNAASRGLPYGIIYDDGSGRDRYQQYVGGSNGQTSLLPFFDIVLGIEHDKKNQDFLKEMHGYMPGAHVRFLKAISQFSNLKDFVLQHQPNQELKAAYNTAVASLKALRDKHVIVVTRYIVLPGRKSARETGSEPQGSAGASPLPLLQGMRKDTSNSAID